MRAKIGPKTPLSDKETFLNSLKIYDRPESELHHRPLDEDVDTDAFIDGAFGNITLPPT